MDVLETLRMLVLVTVNRGQCHSLLVKHPAMRGVCLGLAIDCVFSNSSPIDPRLALRVVKTPDLLYVVFVLALDRQLIGSLWAD